MFKNNFKVNRQLWSICASCSCLHELWRLVCRLLMTCSCSAGMRGYMYISFLWLLATFYYIPYLIECKKRVFPEIWCLNMWDCLKFSYNVPNPIMLSQTNACIVKTPCEICTTLVGYYTAKRGNSIPTFRDNLWDPYSKVKKFKRENKAQLKLTDSLLFLGNSSII